MLSSPVEKSFAGSGAEYTIIRATVPPRIDGKLDDVVWSLITPAELALTNNRTEATKLSLAYAVYDDKFIYVGFHRFEPDLKKLVTNAQNRDGSVWEDDEFELFLDVNHDHLDYWQICINSDNVIWDCFNSGGGCDGAENTDWETATSLGQRKIGLQR